MQTTFDDYFFFFILELPTRRIHFFICSPFFNYNTILEINTTHHYKFMCPLYSHVEALHIIIMNECPRFHMPITPHL